MPGRFIVVSGLPGCGKTTLARRLAPVFGLPVIDKDEILERLFDRHAPASVAERRTLSRDSDLRFRAEAEAADGAILVSFWHLEGMPADSGTPTDWLSALTPHVHVHCRCPPELAAARFRGRRRHPGHLDARRTEADVLESLQRLASLAPPPLLPRLDVETTVEPELEPLVAAIRRGFGEQRD